MIRGDVIDYRRICDQLRRDEHPFIGIDRYPDPATGISEFTKSGWDGNAETLLQTCNLMADPYTGRILAVGVYVNAPKSAMPVLMWIHTDTCRIEPRFYEVEYAEFLAKEGRPCRV